MSLCIALTMAADGSWPYVSCGDITDGSIGRNLNGGAEMCTFIWESV